MRKIDIQPVSAILVIGPKVDPFWDYLIEILNMNPQKKNYFGAYG